MYVYISIANALPLDEKSILRSQFRIGMRTSLNIGTSSSHLFGSKHTEMPKSRTYFRETSNWLALNLIYEINQEETIKFIIEKLKEATLKCSSCHVQYILYLLDEYYIYNVCFDFFACEEFEKLRN